MPRKRRRAYARQSVNWLSVFDLFDDGRGNTFRREESLRFWNAQRAEIMAFRDKEYPGTVLWPELEEQQAKEQSA